MAVRRARRMRPGVRAGRAPPRARTRRGPADELAAAPFRQAGRLDPAGVLRIAKAAFTVEISDEPAATEALWEAAEAVFQDAAADAIRRGEFLVVEPGGWDTASEPYACRRGPAARTTGAGTSTSRPGPRRALVVAGTRGRPVGQRRRRRRAGHLRDALAGSCVGVVADLGGLPVRRRAHVGTQPDGPWSPD